MFPLMWSLNFTAEKDNSKRQYAAAILTSRKQSNGADIMESGSFFMSVEAKTEMRKIAKAAAIIICLPLL